MADVYNTVHLHLIWATYDRLPKLTDEVRDLIYPQIIAAGRELRCPVQAIGGIEDHVHVLVEFATTTSIADLVRAMKGSSSHLVNARLPDICFKWQGTYGVVPVSPRGVIRVTEYIQNQQTHHHTGTVHPVLERAVGGAVG